MGRFGLGFLLLERYEALAVWRHAVERRESPDFYALLVDDPHPPAADLFENLVVGKGSADHEGCSALALGGLARLVVENR